MGCKKLALYPEKTAVIWSIYKFGEHQSWLSDTIGDLYQKIIEASKVGDLNEMAKLVKELQKKLNKK